MQLANRFNIDHKRCSLGLLGFQKTGTMYRNDLTISAMINARMSIQNKPKIFLYEWDDDELKNKKSNNFTYVYFKANHEIHDEENPINK